MFTLKLYLKLLENRTKNTTIKMSSEFTIGPILERSIGTHFHSKK